MRTQAPLYGARETQSIFRRKGWFGKIEKAIKSHFGQCVCAERGEKEQKEQTVASRIENVECASLC